MRLAGGHLQNWAKSRRVKLNLDHEVWNPRVTDKKNREVCVSELVKSKSEFLKNQFGWSTEMFGTRFIVVFAGLFWLAVSDARRLANAGDKRGHDHFSPDARINEPMSREARERGWICNDYYYECLAKNRAYLGRFCVHFYFDFNAFHCIGLEHPEILRKCRTDVDSNTDSIRRGSLCGWVLSNPNGVQSVDYLRSESVGKLESSRFRIFNQNTKQRCSMNHMGA